MTSTQKTTTDGAYQWRPARAEQKAIRVRQLTDPLGAWGFRRPGARIRRETGTRRIVIGTLVAIYFAIVGALYVNQPVHEEPVASSAANTSTTNRNWSLQVAEQDSDSHSNTRSS